MNERMFKGYVPMTGKKPAEPIKNRTEFHLLEEVDHLYEYGGVLKDDIILVDSDFKEESDVLLKIIKDLKINCNILKTTRGIHMYFKNTDVTGNKIANQCPLSLTLDYKLGSKNTVVPLKINGVERKWLREVNSLDSLPIWLIPIGKNVIDFSQLGEGDGRNQALFNYILKLQSEGLSKDEIRTTIEIINKYVLKEPLPERELEVILRDEAFLKQSFYRGKTLQYRPLAEYMRDNDHVIKIDNLLHIYKDGAYTSDVLEIEKAMLKYINNSTKTQRNEVMRYLEILCENKEQAPSNFVAVKNGVFDITSDKLLPHDPKIIITNKIPWNYNESAYDENVDGVLDKVTCNDKALRLILEEMVGYSFFRTSEFTKTFFLTGDGANGKSTFFRMLKTLLGKDNYSSLGLEDLKYQFRLAEMDGKLANIGDDIDSTYLKNTGTFKKIADGNDLVVERKGQDAITKVITAKLIFSVNQMPRMRDFSYGAKRRLLFIPFNAVFSKEDPDFDPFIKYKIVTESAMEYLLKLGIEGIRRLIINKGFTPSTLVNKELEEYEEMNDPIVAFLNEFDIEDKFTDDIFLKYSAWCVQNGYEQLSHISFSRRICSHGYKTERSTVLLDGKRPYVFIKEND